MSDARSPPLQKFHVFPLRNRAWRTREIVDDVVVEVNITEISVGFLPVGGIG